MCEEGFKFSQKREGTMISAFLFKCLDGYFSCRKVPIEGRVYQNVGFSPRSFSQIDFIFEIILRVIDFCGKGDLQA